MTYLRPIIGGLLAVAFYFTCYTWPFEIWIPLYFALGVLASFLTGPQKSKFLAGPFWLFAVVRGVLVATINATGLQIHELPPGLPPLPPHVVPPLHMLLLEGLIQAVIGGLQGWGAMALLRKFSPLKRNEA